MTDVKTIEGDFGGSGRKFAIVAARFNGYIVDSLVDGAIDTLVRHGVKIGWRSQPRNYSRASKHQNEREAFQRSPVREQAW